MTWGQEQARDIERRLRAQWGLGWGLLSTEYRQLLRTRAATNVLFAQHDATFKPAQELLRNIYAGFTNN